MRTWLGFGLALLVASFAAAQQPKEQAPPDLEREVQRYLERVREAPSSFDQTLPEWFESRGIKVVFPPPPPCSIRLLEGKPRETAPMPTAEPDAGSVIRNLPPPAPPCPDRPNP